MPLESPLAYYARDLRQKEKDGRSGELPTAR